MTFKVNSLLERIGEDAKIVVYSSGKKIYAGYTKEAYANPKIISDFRHIILKDVKAKGSVLIISGITCDDVRS